MKRINPPANTDMPLPWEDRPVSRERWQHNRDVLMSNAIGERPPEWWVYERHMDEPGPPYMQARVLYEMGELCGAELERVMGWWRGHYDAAEDCDDHAARRWHLEGIPPAVIKEWDRERKRNEK